LQPIETTGVRLSTPPAQPMGGANAHIRQNLTVELHNNIEFRNQQLLQVPRVWKISVAKDGLILSYIPTQCMAHLRTT